VDFQELLSLKIEHLLHELSVLPFDNMDFHGAVTGLGVLTNYTTWLIIAAIVVAISFTVAANSSKRRMALAAQSQYVGRRQSGGHPDASLVRSATRDPDRARGGEWC